MDPGDELAGAERLGEVVVGADARPTTRSVSESRAVSIRTGTGRSRWISPAHLEAVEAREHEVEDDEVGLEPLARARRRPGRRRRSRPRSPRCAAGRRPRRRSAPRPRPRGSSRRRAAGGRRLGIAGPGIRNGSARSPAGAVEIRCRSTSSRTRRRRRTRVGRLDARARPRPTATSAGGTCAPTAGRLVAAHATSSSPSAPASTRPRRGSGRGGTSGRDDPRDGRRPAAVEPRAPSGRTATRPAPSAPGHVPAEEPGDELGRRAGRQTSAGAPTCSIAAGVHHRRPGRRARTPRRGRG